MSASSVALRHPTNRSGTLFLVHTRRVQSLIRYYGCISNGEILAEHQTVECVRTLRKVPQYYKRKYCFFFHLQPE